MEAFYSRVSQEAAIRLEREIDNWRAALDLCHHTADRDLAAQLRYVGYPDAMIPAMFFLAFWAALAAQALVFVLYFNLTISYLWYPLIGCAACVFFSLILQATMGNNQKPIKEFAS